MLSLTIKGWFTDNLRNERRDRKETKKSCSLPFHKSEHLNTKDRSFHHNHFHSTFLVEDNPMFHTVLFVYNLSKKSPSFHQKPYLHVDVLSADQPKSASFKIPYFPIKIFSGLISTRQQSLSLDDP